MSGVRVDESLRDLPIMRPAGAQSYCACYQWVRAAWRRFPLATLIGTSGAGHSFH
jgi:hypothetical protein